MKQYPNRNSLSAIQALWGPTSSRWSPKMVKSRWQTAAVELRSHLRALAIKPDNQVAEYLLEPHGEQQPQRIARRPAHPPSDDLSEEWNGTRWRFARRLWLVRSDCRLAPWVRLQCSQISDWLDWRRDEMEMAFRGLHAPAVVRDVDRVRVLWSTSRDSRKVRTGVVRDRVLTTLPHATDEELRELEARREALARAGEWLRWIGPEKPNIRLNLYAADGSYTQLMARQVGTVVLSPTPLQIELRPPGPRARRRDRIECEPLFKDGNRTYYDLEAWERAKAARRTSDTSNADASTL